MPYSRHRKRYPRRYGSKRVVLRRPRPRVVPRRGAGAIPRGVPFPQTLVCKLNYSDKFTVSPSLGVAAAHQFNLLNLYDVDRTGAGAQPYFYDQLTTLYGKSVVYASSIRLRFVSTGSVKVICRPAQSTAAPSDLPLEEMRPYSRHYMYAAGGNAGHIRNYVSISKLYGVTKNMVLTDDLYAQVTGSSTPPTHTGVWNIIANTLDGSSSASVYCNILVTYYVKFFQRKSVAGS